MSWREISGEVIHREIQRGRREGKSNEEIVAAVDAAYPFGMRHYHPYRQWLKARRELFSATGLGDFLKCKPVAISSKRPAQNEDPNQLDLFQGGDYGKPA